MDIAADREGFSLLVGIPGYSSFLVELGEDFQVENKGERTPTPVNRTIRIYREGTDLFSLALNPDVSSKGYTVCKNEALIAETGIPQQFEYTASLVAYGGVSYLKFSCTGQYSRIYVDGKLAAEAGESADETVACEPQGFWDTSEGVLLAVSIFQNELMPDGGNSYANAKEYDYLIPIPKDGSRLESERIRQKAATECGHSLFGCVSLNGYGYYIDGNELFGTDGETSQLVCDLLANGIERDTIRRILPLPDHRAVILGDRFLVEVRPCGDSRAKKEIITIGFTYGDKYMLERAVAHYNRGNHENVITVKEFRDQTSMNLALLSGELGGVASADCEIINNYGKKKILLDLKEEIPELFHNNYVFSNLAAAMKTGRACYGLPRLFGVVRPALPLKAAGGKTAFQSWDEVNGVLKVQDPGFPKWTTKRTVLTNFVYCSLSEWINRRTESFSSRDFIDFLLYCNGHASDNNEAEANQNKNQTGYDLHLVQINHPETPELLCLAGEDQERGNDQKAFVSLPCFENAAILTPFLIGVVDDTDSKTGAAAFVRWLFFEADWKADFANEEAPLFSAVTEECHAYISDTWEPGSDEDRAEISEQVQIALWDTLSTADHYMFCNEDILFVVEDEAFRYFAGEITAEKAAEYIQNRVSIYLAEQG